ncbi:MAG: HAD-IIA family hydrolase [Armatimonadota bacterium]
MPGRVPKRVSGLAKRFQAFIFDLDGVVYRGNQPLPHAVETINLLLADGREVFFVTNNSGATRKQYAERLQQMGIPTSPERVLTSGWATVHYLRQHMPRARLFVVGEQGLKQELRAAGFRLVDDPETQLPDAVVVGIDREFTYQRLAQAQWAILQGAQFIATNTDSTYPAEDRLLPGAGSIVAAICTATGKQPLVMGKPNPRILLPLLDEHRITLDTTLMIGDRLETDIALAHTLHMPSALVLTGVTTREALESAPIDQLPHWVLENLGDLLGDPVELLLIRTE